MSKPVFGVHRSNKKTEDIQNIKVPIMDLIKQKLKTKEGLWLLFFIIMLLLCIVRDDRSRIFYCDIPQNFCELRITSNLGMKSTKPLFTPDKIESVSVDYANPAYSKSNPYKRRHAYVINIKDKNNHALPVIKMTEDRYFDKGINEKFNLMAEDINELLKNEKNIINYDLVKEYKKK